MDLNKRRERTYPPASSNADDTTDTTSRNLVTTAHATKPAHHQARQLGKPAGGSMIKTS
jgi:hypothetical protein